MKLLLVDDDPDIHRFVRTVLPADRFEVIAVGSAEEAWALLEGDAPEPDPMGGEAGRPNPAGPNLAGPNLAGPNPAGPDPIHLALIDWFLPGMSGLELCTRIRARPDGDSFYLILFTAHHNKESLEAVVAGGADDYLVKPLDLHLFRIRMALARGHAAKLRDKRALEERIKLLESQMPASPKFHDLVGKSKGMGQVVTLIRELAKVDASVLVTGETGTGKELVARALHAESQRRRGPFIAVNCGGLSEHLVASQLFGHRRGSFTGAVSDQQGVFEAADGGTLFLDEIGDLPMEHQTNFLRVLETREVTRIGETQTRKVNVRVVAATHQDLAQLCLEKKFREDLLYRIKVGRIHLPPLRERREDIPYLVHHFLDRGTPLIQKKVRVCEEAAMGRLLGFSWPGNIRELRNAVEFAMIRCRQDRITVDDLPPEISVPPASPVPRPGVTLPVAAPEMPLQTSADFSSRALHLFYQSGGDVEATARACGVSLPSLYRRSPETFKAALDHAMKQTGGKMAEAAGILGLSRATLYRRLKSE